MAPFSRKTVFRIQIQATAAYWALHHIVDFVCLRLRLIIEADGGQHTDAAEYDQSRTAWLEGQSYRVLRFWNNDILQRIGDVLDSILNVLESPR